MNEFKEVFAGHSIADEANNVLKSIENGKIY